MKRHLDGSRVQELLYKNAQRILKNEKLDAGWPRCTAHA